MYGKEGKSGKDTAQVKLALIADGTAMKIPKLVQPDSKQECLLGMNAIPKLGLQLLHSNGKPVCAEAA